MRDKNSATIDRSLLKKKTDEYVKLIDNSIKPYKWTKLGKLCYAIDVNSGGCKDYFCCKDYKELTQIIPEALTEKNLYYMITEKECVPYFDIDYIYFNKDEFLSKINIF